MANQAEHFHAGRGLKVARRGMRGNVVQSLLAAALLATTLTGCGGQQKGQTGGQDPDGGQGQEQGQLKAQGKQGQRHGQRMQAAGNGDANLLNESGQAIVTFEDVDGKPYADAEKMAGLIGFNTTYSEDGKTLMIGDHDVVMSLKDQSRTATKEEKSLQLDAPARLKDGRMLVPVSALKPLFDEEAVFTVDNKQAAIFPQPPLADPAADEGQDFGDDPADPAKAEMEAEAAWQPDDGFGAAD